MSFTEIERIKLAEKVIAAGVRDSDPTTQWYESVNPETRTGLAEDIWLQGPLLKANPAADLATAQANAAGPLAGVIQDLSLPASAIRLTPDLAVNNTYIAYSVYGNYASQRLGSWVQPQLIPQASGEPSFGYSIRLFDGDPNAGGFEILTTDGSTGTGVNKSVGWFWDYSSGVLLLADDFVVSDPWVLGFRYIGSTAASIVRPTLTAGEVITAGDVLTVDTSGRVVKARSLFAVNRWRVAFLAYTGGAFGASVELAVSGSVAPVQFALAPAAVNNGSHVFLSNSSGLADLTPPAGAGQVVFVVGILQGADGVTTTPDIVFLPQYISRRP